MPIHDQSYRRYKGDRATHGTRWLVITRTGVQSIVRKRTFMILLFLSWVPFFGYCLMFYLSSNFGQVSDLIKTQPETFRNFFSWQETFVFFITLFAGSPLIASDRRANALQLYLSKPMSRAEYIAGKLGVLAALLLFVTWLPAILLLVVQIALSGSTQFIRQNLFLFPAITLYSTLQVGVAAFTILALSSLSKSAPFVGILYAVAMFFSAAISGVLEFATRGSSLAWVSIGANIERLGDVIFRMPPSHDNHWLVSLLVILGLIVVSVSVLERRVRAVEIIT